MTSSGTAGKRYCSLWALSSGHITITITLSGAQFPHPLRRWSGPLCLRGGPRMRARHRHGKDSASYPTRGQSHIAVNRETLIVSPDYKPRSSIPAVECFSRQPSFPVSKQVSRAQHHPRMARNILPPYQGLVSGSASAWPGTWESGPTPWLCPSSRSAGKRSPSHLWRA